MCAQHPNTVFLGMVPSERVLPMTLESHAVLIMSDPQFRINKIGLSNKMFDAMATGRPVIVTQGLPMGEIVTREECGIAVPYTKEGFRSAVERLRDDPSLAARLGRNGLAAAKRAPAKKATARKAATRKATAKKATTRKTTAKKTTAKKASAKKPTARKAAPKP